MPLVKELKKEAKSLGISGYSKMNKPTLIEAIRKHREEQVDKIVEKGEITDDDVETLTDWVMDVKEQVDEDKYEESSEDSMEDTTVPLDDTDIHHPSQFHDVSGASSSDVDSFSSLVDNLFKSEKTVSFSTKSTIVETAISEEDAKSTIVETAISKEDANHWLCCECNLKNSINRPTCKRCGFKMTDKSRFTS